MNMEFREMRRRRQLLEETESRAILQRQTAGVLAVSGDDGYPYAVPVSYVCQDEWIYLHSALNGHKIDAIRREPKVSFCVIDQDQVIPETFTTHFRSVIVFGRARIIEEEAEKKEILTVLGAKYAPELPQEAKQEIASQIHRTCVIAIRIEHMTGKEAIELVRSREQR